MAKTTNSGGRSTDNTKKTTNSTRSNSSSTRSNSRRTTTQEKSPKHSEVIKDRENERAELRKLKEAAKKKQVSDEVTYVIVALIAIILYLSLFGVCGVIGRGIKVALYFLFGRVVSFIFPAMLIGIVVYIRIHPDDPLATRKSTIFCIFVALFSALMHVVSGSNTEKFTSTFHELSNGIGGGFFGALISESLFKLFGTIATIIIIIVLMLICVMMVFHLTPIAYMKNREVEKPDQYEFYDDYSDYEEEQKKKRAERASKREEVSDYHQMNLTELQQTRSKREMSEGNRREMQTVDFNATPQPKKKKDNIVKRLINNGRDSGSMETPDNTTSRISPKDITTTVQPKYNRPVNANGVRITEVPIANDRPIYDREMERKFNSQTVIDEDITKERVYEDDEDYYYKLSKQEPKDLPRSTRSVTSVPVNTSAGRNVITNAGATVSTLSPVITAPSAEPETVNTAVPTAEDIKNAGLKEQRAEAKKDNTPAEQIVIDSATEVNKPYVFPSINLLDKPKKSGNGSLKSQSYYDSVSNTLEDTFRSFGVEVEVTNISVGPTVTRYEIKPAIGVKVSRITALADDIKLALAIKDIRIEAPIPGKPAVGIEVPNDDKDAVLFRQLLESDEFQNSKGKLSFAVGLDISGQMIIGDVARMPHMLVAGATGSGKSVFTNSIIMSILYKYKPEDVRLILIDPKMVEFNVYNGIPHLLLPVVIDPKKANSALKWAVMEMTDRYQKFTDLHVKDLSGYNKKIASEPGLLDKAGIPYKHLPLILIVIDELADLMTVASKDVEESICRLAQLARAAGLHLIIATQRPSVDVITGLIKANIPSRVALSVSSAIDSRTILDQGGAEKLLGHGDMLYKPADLPNALRVQGSYISETEIERVVEFLKKNNDEASSGTSEIDTIISNGVPSVSDQMNGQTTPDDGRDEYFAEAGRFIIQKDKASIGMLQRIYKIGFNRAARIMDQLCDAGVVGPEEGTKPRKILMTEDEFNSFLNQ